MYTVWSEKLEVGDLIQFDEEFYNSLVSAGIGIERIGLITEAKEMFYCVRSGVVDDLWVSIPDIKKVKVYEREEVS